MPVAAPTGTGAMILEPLQLVGIVLIPLKVTVLVPWLAPKFVPAIVTEVPAGPDVGFKLLTLGGSVTVKGTPLLATPTTVTTTFPVVAPAGTGATMLVALQLVGVAVVPLKVTVLVPWDAPKFVPVIVTEEPTGPEVGLRPVMFGGGRVTVKITWLLPAPPTTTSTRSFPVGAPVGTGTEILVALQLVGVAVTPLNLTVLVPCEAPKFVPVIVTGVPAGPEVGLKSEMFGGETVKLIPLLATPPTVTTTFPFVAPVGTDTAMLVALQLVGVAVVPLKVTVLVPCVAPKLVPVIVTEVPAGPLFGLRPLMLGDVTVKGTALLVTPPTVTVTFPVVAPLGTGATILV